MKNRIQTAPVIRSDRNGRRMSPFSWRRTPRLTFVSCQPMRRRSRNPSFRGAGEYGADGTVGVGVHMGYQRPMLSSSFESSAGIPPHVAQPTRGSGWKRAESVMNGQANPLQGFEVRSGRLSRDEDGTTAFGFGAVLIW